MTNQYLFGGSWTQHKLKVLEKYLKAYTKIFKKNPKGQYFTISYVDAFAGTGALRRPALGGLGKLIPELQEIEEDFRKGSARRALEIEPPFDKYVFIEKDSKKCRELHEIARAYPSRNIKILNEDANSALLKWTESLDIRRERAVVFLDPFGASVEWKVIEALGKTRAVDLWLLFPYSAINRMLVRKGKPPKAWAARLTSVFGTPKWEEVFYSTSAYESLLDSTQIEITHKRANHREILDFFVERLKTAFCAVSQPLLLNNSTGLLFVLFFAAANGRSGTTGLRIANDIIGG